MSKSRLNGAADAAAAAMTMPDRPQPMRTAADYLSSGLTTVNLCLQGQASGGIPKGTIARLVGRKESGKSFVCTTILAEASINPAFKDYLLIYDDYERGRRTDLRFFFGVEAAKRIQPPAWLVDKKAKTRRPSYSVTLGQFYDRVVKMLQKGTKFVWVIDSIDALQPDKATKMGDGKAKANNWGLRDILDGLDATGSILLIVNQSHIDIKSMFGGETTSGGLALEYYPAVDLWLKKVMTLTKSYNGTVYNVGTLVSCRVKKNRVSGGDRTLYFPFAPTYGIDDVGACVDYLTRVKHWEKESVKKKKDEGADDDESRLIVSPRKIVAPEFDFEGSRRELIAKIENEDLLAELKVLTAKAWHGVEAALREDRKPRYN